MNDNIFDRVSAIAIDRADNIVISCTSGDVLGPFMDWQASVFTTMKFHQLKTPVFASEGPQTPIFLLHQNYPNPFNPTTTIRYGLPEASDVTLVIYDIQGRQVRTMVNQTQEAGWHTVQWNGLTEDGTSVGTGMSFARIQAGE